MADTNSLNAAVLRNQSIQSVGLDRGKIVELVRQESNGPYAVRLFSWLCAQAEDSIAGDLLVELISATRDPATLAEVVSLLSRQDLGDVLRRRLWNTFLSCTDNKSLSYGVRAQALHGMLLLAQSQKGLLHRLKGFLADLDVDDEPHFLRHAAKILGVMLAHSPEPEFRDKLNALLALSEVKDEAAMALGLDELRIGLDAVTADSAAKAFENALYWFGTSLEFSEERVDAELYVFCLDILVKVHRDGFTDNPIADIAGLSDAAWRYSAYLGSDDELHSSWLGMQSSERLHWTLLASKLGTLGAQLNKRVWINAVRIIEDELLAVYRASQSILFKEGDTGIELILRPKLAASLLVNRRHLDELDQWIDEKKGSPLLPDAEAMRQAVYQAREASLLHHPFEGWSDGPALQAILDAGRVPLEARKSVAALLQSTVADLSANENPIIAQIVEGILTKMERNRHYSTLSSARSLFTAILILSVYFLSHRHDTGTASDPDGDYLFARSPESLPLEHALQKDYFRLLRMSSLHNHVKMEVRDQGAGRADVYFSALGVSTVTEVKRTMRDLSHEDIIHLHGPQTAAYQTTNVTFGFLLVLDLFDRNGAQPHLAEQVSLQTWTPPGQTTVYDVVVMRVQGQRKRPASIH
ncbi:hypothetical protein [Methylobacillus methanolivorans]